MWPPDKLCPPSMLSATCAATLLCTVHQALTDCTVPCRSLRSCQATYLFLSCLPAPGLLQALASGTRP